MKKIFRKQKPEALETNVAEPTVRDPDPTILFFNTTFIPIPKN